MKQFSETLIVLVYTRNATAMLKEKNKRFIIKQPEGK